MSTTHPKSSQSLPHHTALLPAAKHAGLWNTSKFHKDKRLRGWQFLWANSSYLLRQGGTFSLFLVVKLAKVTSSIFLLQPSSSYPLISSKYGWSILKTWADNLQSNKKSELQVAGRGGKVKKKEKKKATATDDNFPRHWLISAGEKFHAGNHTDTIAGFVRESFSFHLTHLNSCCCCKSTIKIAAKLCFLKQAVQKNILHKSKVCSAL